MIYFILPFALVLATSLIRSYGFQQSSTSHLARQSRLISADSKALPRSVLASSADSTADTKPVEWKGAKAISGKDKELKTVLNIEQIANILPHRYPFLLVDRVVEFEPGKRAVGIKSITMNEPQFTGHFPNRPIMPGVLMIEAMAQLGGLICLSPPINNDGPGRLFFFAGINGVRWKSPVTPGDQLVMEMTLEDFNEKIGFAKMSGKAYVGGKIAVSVEEFTFALAKN
eukprot:gene9470-10284_t